MTLLSAVVAPCSGRATPFPPALYLSTATHWRLGRFPTSPPSATPSSKATSPRMVRVFMRCVEYSDLECSFVTTCRYRTAAADGPEPLRLPHHLCGDLLRANPCDAVVGGARRVCVLPHPSPAIGTHRQLHWCAFCLRFCACYPR